MGKGSKWQDEENINLCRSVLSIGQNPITGADQPGEAFWNKVYGEWLKKMGFANRQDLHNASSRCKKYLVDIFEQIQQRIGNPARTANALKSHWTKKINKHCQLFSACYETAKNPVKSGWQEADYFDLANKLFEERIQPSGRFMFMSSWMILKQEPKWATFGQV